MIKRYFRKHKHRIYVRALLNELRWDTINTTISASATGWTVGVTKHLENNGRLIRKYERRLRWLKF